MNIESKAAQAYLNALPDQMQLQKKMTELCEAGEQVGFICYDIKSLRKINRAYGRIAGDNLLAAVAEWTQCLTGGSLYRVESDAFCILFKNIRQNTLERYAGVMEARFDKVWHLELESGPLDIFTRAAISIVAIARCDHIFELPDLLEQALELSRERQQFTVFTEEYDRMTRDRVRLQMELKACILSDMQGFSLLYQPIADPVTGSWRGLEALCRWTGPTIGSVPPNIFIAETEEMGLIHQLGDWVLDRALEQCREMRLDRIEHFFISVNVSAPQLNRRNYLQKVINALEKHDYPAGKLLLEITESTQFTLNEITMSAIHMLRAKGVMFALDDFGSGYSGFSNLKNIPVDILKTEREFTENIENDSYLQYFYYIMSETAHANKMRLIAEGIETQEQLRSVVKNGADLIQGYLFGRPMDRESVEKNIACFTTELSQFSNLMSDLGDLKQWMHSQDAYRITPALFGLQSMCINTILDDDDLDKAIEKILETVGTHFKVNRAYVFLQDEGTIFSNRYEWCAQGVEVQKHLFQSVNAMEDGFYDVLRENEVVIARDATQLPDNMKERLKNGNQQESIQSFVVMPMKRHGEIIGFVGFDDCTSRDWMPEELIILHNLCLLCLIILAKDNPEQGSIV